MCHPRARGVKRSTHSQQCGVAKLITLRYRYKISLSVICNVILPVSFSSWCCWWQTPCQVAVIAGKFGVCCLGGWPEVGVSVTCLSASLGVAACLGGWPEVGVSRTRPGNWPPLGDSLASNAPSGTKHADLVQLLANQ